MNKAPEIRDKISTIKKQISNSETINIYAVGDSFTHGVLENRDSSWVSDLNQIIRSDKNLNYKIYNLGVSGTNIIRQCKIIEEIKEIDENPIFIHQLFVNDFYGKDWEKYDSFEKFYGNHAGKIFKKFPMHFMHYVYKALKKSSLKNNSFLDYTLQFKNQEKKHWEKIKELYSSCYKKNGLKTSNTFTFLYPSMTWGGKTGWTKNTNDYPYEEFDKVIIKKLKEVNIEVFNLLPELKKKIPVASEYWLSKELPDAHPNKFANSVAAKAIAKEMKNIKFFE